jgi:hypothetical protein
LSSGARVVTAERKDDPMKNTMAATCIAAAALLAAALVGIGSLWP